MQNSTVIALTAALLFSHNVAASDKAAKEDVSASPEKITTAKKYDSSSDLKKFWNLSDAEISRYQEILHSPRAYFTPNLEHNPLLALALESKNPAERAKYADRWVKIQYDNNVKVMSWALEVSEAWKRNYPGVPRYAYKNSPQKSLAISNITDSQNSGASLADFYPSRAQLYIKADNCDECVNAFWRLYNMTKGGKYSGVDVHFVGGTNDSIVKWAVTNKLNPSEVNDSKLITLNISEKNVDKVPYIE